MQYIEVLPAGKHIKALEDAIKTIRRSHSFGKSGGRVDFEFPTADDLRKMVTNIPTKIKVLKHKKSTKDSDWFGAF